MSGRVRMGLATGRSSAPVLAKGLTHSTPPLPFGLQPEKAVRAFELALEYQPKDSELIRRIARALVTTHDYSRAIDFYNKAIYIARSNWSLLLELATLLVRLQQWQPAVATLNKCLERQKVGGVDTSLGGGHGVEEWTRRWEVEVGGAHCLK
eukprot:208442-Chlamydomonas_euryale.AAC.5